MARLGILLRVDIIIDKIRNTGGRDGNNRWYNTERTFIVLCLKEIHVPCDYKIGMKLENNDRGHAQVVIIISVFFSFYIGCRQFP